MEALVLDHSKRYVPTEAVTLNEENIPLEERVKLGIIRDLWNLNWKIQSRDGKTEVIPPESYDKTDIRQAMLVKRNEVISNNRHWINKHIALARLNMVDGSAAINSTIEPEIEICETEKQHKLFRIFRYYWSSPYSEYVGRRIRFIIRDGGLLSKPVIGIAALGSSIIHIPERDQFIGWDKKTRTNNFSIQSNAVSRKDTL